ncbi:MAG: alpha/beta hydrolase [Planctomycetes bacterium]|nr:alpha/beta hydrolase [Planctomycetota bacterium]
MRIDVNGRQVGYEDSGGSGLPLVLIHGFPLDRTVWAGQSAGLGDVARVIALDLRGFGESALGGTTASVDDYAADVCDLLDALGVKKAVVGGVSMGGYVAMAFHRRFADRLIGLVLVDTRAGADSAEAKFARDASAALARAEGASAIAAQMIGKMLTPETARRDERRRRSLLDMMSAQPTAGVVAALGALRNRPDSTESIRAVAVPTLIVSGADDLLIPPKESQAMQAASRGARLALIPAAAHLPNYEQPAAFNAAVREFLATIEAR